MANILNQVGQSFSTYGWSSFGDILSIVVILFACIFVFGGIALFMWWKSYNIPVKIYEPLGRVPLEEGEFDKIKEEVKKGEDTTLKSKKLQFDNVKYRRTNGKFTLIKGNPYFCTFMPLMKHEPIPMEFMYDTGVYLVRISKDILVPIHKPKTIVEVGQSTNIKVAEHNKWRIWNNMMADRINNKYQDIDAQRKLAMYHITGIVALVLVGGFILWLIYASVNKGFDAAEKFNTAAESILGNSPK